MIDIVERLRHPCDPLLDDAADKIEQLKDMLDHMGRRLQTKDEELKRLRIALESKQPHTALKILKAALTESALKDTP